MFCLKLLWIRSNIIIIIIFLLCFLERKNNYVKCAKNPRDPPMVNIPGQGVVTGKEVVISRAKAFLYLGIPYAQPPIGDLR